MEKFLVFVYGTLLRGYSNHRLLENPVGTATFICAGYTQKMYTMYAQGIPYVSDESETSHIKGELFEVDAETLADLDRLEGHPDFYERKEVPVYIFARTKPKLAWLYFCTPRRDVPVVASGDFKDVRRPVAEEAY